MKKFFIYILLLFCSLTTSAQSLLEDCIPYNIQMVKTGSGTVRAVLGNNNIQYALTTSNGLFIRKDGEDWTQFPLSREFDDFDMLCFGGLGYGNLDVEQEVKRSVFYALINNSKVLRSFDNQFYEYCDLPEGFEYIYNKNDDNLNRILVSPSNNNLIYVLGTGSKAGEIPLIESVLRQQDKFNYMPNTNLPLDQIVSYDCFGVNPKHGGDVFMAVTQTDGKSHVYRKQDKSTVWNEIENWKSDSKIIKFQVYADNDLAFLAIDKTNNESKISFCNYNYYNVWKTFSFNSVLKDFCVNAAGQFYAVDSNVYNQTLDNGSGNGNRLYFYANNGENDTYQFVSENYLKVDNSLVSWAHNLPMTGATSCAFVGNNLMVAASEGVYTCANWNSTGQKVFKFDIKGIEGFQIYDIKSMTDGSFYSAVDRHIAFHHTDIDELPSLFKLNPERGTGFSIGIVDGKYCLLSSRGLYEQLGWNSKPTTYEFGINSSCAISSNLANNTDIYYFTTSDGKLIKQTTNGYSQILLGEFVGSVATDYQNNKKNVYALGKDKFFYSYDYGQTFNEIALANNNNGDLYYSFKMTVAPDGAIYVAGGWWHSLYKSVDNGKTFEEIPLVGNCLSVSYGVGNPEMECEYVIYSFMEYDRVRGIYRSLDKGESWELIRGKDDCYGGCVNGVIEGDKKEFGKFYMAVSNGILCGTALEIENCYWKGTSDSLWSNTKNWKWNLKPNKFYNAIIEDYPLDDDIEQFMPTITSEDRNPIAKSLTIRDEKTLKIYQNGQLTIQKNTLVEEGSSLILESQEANNSTGTFINNGTFEGKITINRIMPKGWSRVSLPVSEDENQTSNLFTFVTDPFFNPNFHHFDSNFNYDELEDVDFSSLSGKDLENTLAKAWKAPFVDFDTPYLLKKGEGYHYYNFEDTTINIKFVGGVNSSSFDYTVSHFNSSDARFKNWVCLGNPYTAYLDFREFCKDNSNMTLCILDEASGNYMFCNSLGVKVNNCPSRVPVAQSFFVQTAANNFVFKPSQRAHSPKDSTILYNSNQTISKKLMANNIRLSLNDDEIYLNVGNGFSNSFEEGIDVIKFFNKDCNFYSLVGKNQFAINYLENTDEIKLGFENNVSQNNIIKAQEINFDCDVFLIDKLLKDTINLKENPIYKFEGQKSDDRFSIKFSLTKDELSEKLPEELEEIMAVDNANFDEIKIYPNPASEYLIIEGKNLKKYQIFDANGKNVLSSKIDEHKKIINLNSLKQGVFFIKIDNQIFKFLKF